MLESWSRRHDSLQNAIKLRQQMQQKGSLQTAAKPKAKATHLDDEPTSAGELVSVPVLQGTMSDPANLLLFCVSARKIPRTLPLPREPRPQVCCALCLHHTYELL